ncbi:MAG: hypothetical protein ABI602_01080, partial [Candidatus Saccharibacteria bacterium]
NLEADASRKRALVGKEVNDQIATGVDSEVRGLTVNKKTSRKRNNAGQIEYETLGGAWVSEASVNKGHSRWGNDTYAQQAALSYEMRKATSEDQIRGLGDNYHNVTDGWGMSANQAGGAWIGAAFENQGQHLEYKYTNWKDGTMGASRPGGDVKSDGFVDEIYEKKGSYPLAQMSSFSVERLKDAHVAAEAIGDVDQMNKIKAISETFMSELGGGMYAPPAGGAGPVVQPGARTNRMANTPGAAHVAERARELADMTGAYVAAPTGPHLPPPDHRGTSTPNNMDQH